LNFEVARQASTPSLSATLRAVPWADEAEQKLSWLDPSGWELSGDIRIFGAGLLEETGSAPIPGLLLKFDGARQASSPTLCASVRAVSWADEAEQQLSRIAPLAANYLDTFAFSEQGCWRRPTGNPQATFEV